MAYLRDQCYSSYTSSPLVIFSADLESTFTVMATKHKLLYSQNQPVHISPVKSRGVILNSLLYFCLHTSNISCTAFFHLCNIYRLQPSLTQYSSQVLIHVLVTCIHAPALTTATPSLPVSLTSSFNDFELSRTLLLESSLTQNPLTTSLHSSFRSTGFQFTRKYIAKYYCLPLKPSITWLPHTYQTFSIPISFLCSSPFLSCSSVHPCIQTQHYGCHSLQVLCTTTLECFATSHSLLFFSLLYGFLGCFERQQQIK